MPTLLQAIILFLLPIQSLASPPVNLGTTLVAIQYRHGVVVGADTRTSVGSYVSNRFAHKISPLTPYCVLARSGSAADTQALALAAREHLEQVAFRYSHGYTTSRQLLSVTQLAHWLQRKVYEEECGSVSLLIAGYNPATQRAELYSLAPSGALLEHHTEGSSFAASGSGSAIVTGFLDHHVKGNLEEEQAVRLAKEALCQAMQRDGSSGGMCRLVVLNDQGRQEWIELPGSRERINPLALQ